MLHVIKNYIIQVPSRASFAPVLPVLVQGLGHLAQHGDHRLPEQRAPAGLPPDVRQPARGAGGGV